MSNNTAEAGMPKQTEPVMISALAANRIFRDKERYKTALEAIVKMDDKALQYMASDVAAVALKGERI